MNKSLLIFAVLAGAAANAQQPYQMTPKEAEKHAKEVAKSKEKGTTIWDYDTVFVDGVPNCIIYKVDRGALHPDDFSIRSLTGQELIYVRAGSAPDYTVAHAPNTPPPTVGYYTYIFSDTKKEGETYNGNRPFKMVGRYHLIVNGNAIDPGAEANFIAENPVRWSVPPPPPSTIVIVNNPPPVQQQVVVNNPPPVQQPVVNNTQPQQNLYTGPANQQQAPPPTNTNLYTGPANQQQAQQPANNNTNLYTGGQVQQLNNASTPNYMLVNRNTSGDISFDHGNVFQGGQQIGTVQYNEVNANGMFTKTMTVILPNGTKVAQAYTMPNGDIHVWHIVTMKDHQQGTVTCHEGRDKEDVLMYLVNGSYL